MPSYIYDDSITKKTRPHFNLKCKFKFQVEFAQLAQDQMYSVLDAAIKVRDSTWIIGFEN